VNSKIEELKELIIEDPLDPFLHYVLALEYEKANEEALAVATLIELMNIRPDYLALYYQLGRILQVEGRSEEAIAVLKKGLDLAQSLKNRHTFSEISSLLSEIMEDDE
jgi:tetratricopeptide (TPR) repeat protein